MNKKNNNGWILCPSKSYPGKLYYFNVLNGEAAWSLNDNEKNVLKEEAKKQNVKTNHSYPEPITPPDHPSPMVSHYHSTIGTCSPKFGQPTFPKYISNAKENMTIIWTPIQMPQLCINTKKTSDQNTQTEQSNIYVHACTIPLSERFENKINESLDSSNCVAASQTNDWWNTTDYWSNISKQSSTPEIEYKQTLDIKSVLKESKLKRLQQTNIKYIDTNDNQKSTKSHCDKVENTKSQNNLDILDLRYVLRAKKNKCAETQHVYNKEHSSVNDDKKVTDNVTTNSKLYSENNDERRTSPRYVVVDLDVLLEDGDCIASYIHKDENCHLYIPKVVQNQLRSLSAAEHGGYSRILRQLAPYTSRLNLPENKDDTTMNQIITNCLELINRNYDVVLITKNIELLETAKLYRLQAHHISDIKNNYKQNLFLQDTCDFDPFIISKTVHASQNYSRQNILDTNTNLIERNNRREPLIDDVTYVYESDPDISDINLNINKLNITDKIINTRGKDENNLFVNKITKSNRKCEFKTSFSNILNEKTLSRNANEIIENRVHNIKDNTITSLNNTTTDALEEKMKRFYIKNNIMEHNLVVRFDEMICCYEQIIEDFVSTLLQKNIQQLKQPPPWYLHEGMKCLKEIFTDNKYVREVIDKLLYYYEVSHDGTQIKPHNFMKLLGCGLLLVEALEGSSSLNTSDVKKNLTDLKEAAERPAEDFPVVYSDSPVRHDGGDTHTHRYNFVKDPSYVLDYLRSHFSEWKNYDEPDDGTDEMEVKLQAREDNIKVLRTVGRHLNKLTISKSKCLSFTTDKRPTRHDSQSNDFPKVFRDIKLVTTEEKIKSHRNGDTCSIVKYLSGNESNETVKYEVVEGNDFKMSSVVGTDMDEWTAGGRGANHQHAYPLVRKFLTELSSSFKIIHTFIDENVKDYSEYVDDDHKQTLNNKATKTHAQLAHIMDTLKMSVVMKCLEQAAILKKSLKLMIAMTGDSELSATTADSLHFTNIYE